MGTLSHKAKPPRSVLLLWIGLLVGTVVIDAALSQEGAQAAETKADNEQRRRVFYNLDCSEFFVGTFGPIVPETIDNFVDSHAAVGITDLLINVNAQRTNYRSDVWESFWDGYDPNAGDDQPFFAGLDQQRIFEVQLFKNHLGLEEQGCDYPKRMIDRARHNQVKAWISLRMNDGHNQHLKDHPAHSTFWKSHPQWHLKYGLDYEQPEVRQHYMRLVREVCARYDMDGLELDFLRFWLYFRPGREHAGIPLISDFVAEARKLTQQAAERLGHPVELAVRVPTRPWVARRHGLDAEAWGKAGWVDLIVATPWFPSIDGDAPLETWKGLLLGTNVEVALSLDTGINSGASGRQPMTHEEMRGVLLSSLHRGADAVYFFNMFASPYQSWPREDHDQLLRDAGSYTALQSGPRRHPLTLISPWAIGEPGNDRELPYTGTHGTFRVPIGPKPTKQQRAQIELVVPGNDHPLEVRLNGTLCAWSGLATPEHITASRTSRDDTERRHVYEVPANALSGGYNLIEVKAEHEIKITWVEISVQ